MLRIAEARWLAPDGTWRDGDVVVEDGRIVQAGGSAPGGEVLDARGGLVLPGAIDAHTHLRSPGQTHKEGADNGSRAAVAGGVTCVLDMPNDRPPTTTRALLEAKAAIYRHECRCHWGLHAQATASPSDADPRRVASAKIYMARSSDLDAVNDVESLRRVFSTFPRAAVHAEDDRLFGPGATHAARRPREAIRRALALVEEALSGLPAQKRARVILAHATTADDVEWLRRMKAKGLDVRGETCPHYLAFTQDDVAREGARMQVNPPIRDESDREVLRAALADGTLDFLSSDHAPHAPAEKASDRPPSGIASIEWMMPFAVKLVAEGLIGWKRLQEITSANAAAAYDIPNRGAIEPGRVADLVVLAPRALARPRDGVVTRAGWTPYRFEQFTHAVRATLVAGRVAYRDGEWADDVRGEELYA